MKQLALFCSGSGTNAENIMEYFQNHHDIRVSCLLSNKAEAFALKRAEKFGVPSLVFSRSDINDTNIVFDFLEEKGVTHIVLAGYLWLVPPDLLNRFAGRILNIHPALLPKYGGKGMYGMHVHQAVKNNNEAESGITIHLADKHYDEGAVLFQAKCALTLEDSPEQIAEKVHQLEYAHYPRVIEAWALGRQDFSTKGI